MQKRFDIYIRQILINSLLLMPQITLIGIDCRRYRQFKTALEDALTQLHFDKSFQELNDIESILSSKPGIIPALRVNDQIVYSHQDLPDSDTLATLLSMYMPNGLPIQD